MHQTREVSIHNMIFLFDIKQTFILWFVDRFVVTKKLRASWQTHSWTFRQSRHDVKNFAIILCCLSQQKFRILTYQSSTYAFSNKKNIPKKTYVLWRKRLIFLCSKVLYCSRPTLYVTSNYYIILSTHHVDWYFK